MDDGSLLLKQAAFTSPKGQRPLMLNLCMTFICQEVKMIIVGLYNL
ncbi:unnamed protein product [Coffea canephora]|uniref:Uncharacterized protein n=1 Tax=Coffea canephora TaxID=49390 RepID=A0A068US68_COFCA|nr:unnamed protein product [Coffea canephora]